ncbi:MRC1-like domain-containing protein [Geopyxis carbonaria]|nr:MRC1-like domain-containing protein [Geopyxis carbonaria]
MSSPASSTPGTPQRSTSRDASPILTPRSKIRALLSLVSDDDSSSSDTPKSAVKKKKASPKPKSKDVETPLFLGGMDVDSNSDEEKSDDDIQPAFSFKPMGGMVGRMRGYDSGDKNQSPAKKSANRNLSPVKSSRGKTPTSSTIDPDDGDDDEDEGPVVPRRKRTGKATQSSPIGSATAASPKPIDDSGSESDNLPTDVFKNDRFMALVAKKKKEREEKEAVEREKERERRERMKDLEVGGDSEDEMPSSSRAAPPRRKAGKKALEEMHRETQRMQRNMQLTHEARTRKKITKQSLFEKFNFKPEGETDSVDTVPKPPPDTSPAVASEPDTIAHDTRGSSPPDAMEGTSKSDGEQELPDLADIFDAMKAAATKKKVDVTPKDKGKGKGIARDSDTDEAPRPAIDKGKGKAVAKSSPVGKSGAPLPLVKIHLPIRPRATYDSDSDLEIVAPEQEEKKEAERLATEKKQLIESLKSKRKLKVQPLKPGQKPKVSAKLLYQQLIEKSRLQAIREKQERIDELRAKGIIVQTAEEREKESQVVENLVEKARLEALKIRKMEKKEKGGKDAKVSDDDEDDEEWLAEADVPEWELSGSEDEEEGGEEEDEEAGNGLVDGEAKEEGSDEDGDVKMVDQKDDITAPVFSLSTTNSPTTTPRLSDMPSPFIDGEDGDDEDGGFELLKRKVPRKKLRVEDDDDEEYGNAGKATVEVANTPVKPQVPDFFKNAQQSPIGMSQLFAGSMAGSMPFGTVPDSATKKIDAMRRDIGQLSNSQIPGGVAEDESQDQVPNTQLVLDYSQYKDDEIVPATQPNEPAFQIEPTQDTGFAVRSPAPPRFASISESPAPARVAPFPESPVATVPLDLMDEEPKIKKGRLMRKAVDFSDEEPEKGSASEADSDFEDVFTILKQSAKRKAKPPPKPKPVYDKKNSEAKTMFNEQAEESEDEYAGIGGGSDDDGDDGDLNGDAEMADLLDDAHQDIDESALAAFDAARTKAADEREVAKLYKDLQSGLLRKKRGAGAFDLDASSDDDDSALAAQRRRRAKRQQLAQIRKHLIQDSALEKIAADPKKAAFFRVLEDNVSDAEEDFLDRGEEQFDLAAFTGSASASASATPSVQPESARDSPVGESQSSVTDLDSQPAARDRRPVRTKKPGLAEVRETLSFLVDETELLGAPDSDSDPDSAPVRISRRTTAVIDRTLTRASSTLTTSTTAASVSRLAFATDTTAPGGFRVPALLRRATTALTGSGESQGSGSGSAATERSLGESQGRGGVRKGGAAKSSINFVSRGGCIGWSYVIPGFLG